METVIDLERTAAAHWRGTEEEWLGGWLLRSAEGFTGRANSALPLGDPGMPLDEALAAVTLWYRDRGLPPMVAVPTQLDTPAWAVSPAQALDRHLSERRWLTRSGPAFVMLADLPLGIHLDGLPAGRAVLASPEPDDAWS
jgi:N-acetylglutamate synthase